MSERVDEARRALGRVGAHIPQVGVPQLPATAVQLDAIRRLERAGFGAAWTNEDIGGKDVFVQIAMLLAATERITLGTDIANIWARAPQIAHAAAAQIADAHPGRFVLGLGAGYPYQAAAVGREYKPLTNLRDYLAQMRQPTPVVAPLDAPYACVLGAHGPKMLELARTAADGAFPVIVPPSFTTTVRDALGPDGLLVVGVTLVVGEDRAGAKPVAQAVLSGLLSFPGSPYAANLVRFGFAEADVLAAADTVLDEIVGYGNGADVATLVDAHIAAGADHVVLMPVTGDFELQLQQLEQVAPSLRF